MKILRNIGIGLAILAAIIIIASIIAPKTFEAHREIVINAPQEVIWKNISTFAGFGQWNPYQKMDPNQKVTLEGTDGTVGAKQSWVGEKTGEGSMTVSKLEPNKTIEYDLFFKAHGGSHNLGYMNMEKVDGGYKVTWGMKGHMPMPFNAAGLVMNLDKVIGKDFETGLADLKKICESTSTGSTASYSVQEINWAEKNCLTIRKTVPFSGLAAFFGESYGKIGQELKKANAKMGIPMGIYYTFDQDKKVTDVAAAAPYEGKKISAKGFEDVTLPAGKAYKLDYYGAYDKMMPAYDAIKAKLKEANVDMNGPFIEEYISDPMMEKDTAKWHTAIYYLVKPATASK